MNETDEKIRKAAQELANALTEGGKDYMVHARSLEEGGIGGSWKRYGYEITVTETVYRDIAP